MRTVLLMLASILPAGYAVASETPVNLVGDPGFEKQPDAGRGTWVGTQNAGKPVFERSEERPHSGQIAAKVTCRTGDVYARWVYQAPDLFARVKRGDRLKLSFWYRASAALGDALVQINHDAAPGWEQYPLKRLKATGDAWVPLRGGVHRGRQSNRRRRGPVARHDRSDGRSGGVFRRRFAGGRRARGAAAGCGGAGPLRLRA